MESIYYHVRVCETCSCCGSDSGWSSSNYKSFSEAREAILPWEEGELITNDPIAKYYIDDERINYVEGE